MSACHAVMEGLVMSIVVAVTGGIGAGKSTVSGLLAARGALVVDSDRLAREVVGPGTAGLSAVVTEFGPGVRTAEGALDRPAMAAIVFTDPGARRRLEAITHPIIRARFAELAAAAPHGSVVVNDIPLLTTLDAAAAFHLAIGVGAPETVRIGRLIARGMTEADARARITAQIGDAERRILCEVWVDNGATPVEARRQTDLLWSRLASYAANVEAARRAGRGGPVLVPYRPEWAPSAARLIARIRHLLGPVRVDHIGSTAVPGLPAKDVIDLQVAVPDLTAADGFAAVLGAGGFPLVPGIRHDDPHPGAPDVDDGSGWEKRLHANADPGLGVNLHLRAVQAPNWQWALRFRDWLRSDAAARESYLDVKRGLAERFAADVSADRFAAAKDRYFAAIDPAVRRWASGAGWNPS